MLVNLRLNFPNNAKLYETQRNIQVHSAQSFHFLNAYNILYFIER